VKKSRRKEMPRVALILPLVFHYDRIILQGIIKYVRIHGPWNFVSIHHSPSTQWPDLNSKNLDGIIGDIFDQTKLKFLTKLGIPVVNVGTQGSLLGLPSVLPDYEAAGRMCARHFLEKGFRSFAFCGTDVSVDREKYKGFLGEIQNSGFSASYFELPSGSVMSWNWEKEKKRLKPWLMSLKKPVGLVGSSSACARQFVSACSHFGMRVPDQIAILGIGNNPMQCELSDIPISSLEMGSERVGFNAAKMLFDLLQGKKPSKQCIRIAPTGVIVRQSTDVVAVDHPKIARAVRYIHENSHRTVRVGELLRLVGISRRPFEVLFRQRLGVSPYEEILRAHLDRAKKLLIETDRSIEEVAERSGFASATQIGRMFRRQIGVTPMQYRKEFKINYQEC
jgi:LacI family transcriptional regulator